MNKKLAKSNMIYDAKEFKDLREMLNNSVNLYPNNTAFIIKNTENENINYTKITYSQLQDDVNSLGTALINLGLKNKRIAIIGKNRYEWAVSYISILNGVGIAVPLDKGLPEQEIILSLNRSLTDAIIFDKSYAEIMKKIQNMNSTSVKQFICMDSISVPSFESFNNLINKGKELLNNGNTEYLNAEIDPEKLSILLFTSGTTSLAKAVMLSHKNICSNIYAMQRFIKIYDTDVNMAFLPFHHTFGSTALLLFLAHGVTNVFCDGLRHIQKNLKEYKVSIFVCVPLLLEAMYVQIQKEIDKKGKRSTVEKGLKISNSLLKIGIDVRRKLFKEIIDNLGGNLRFIVSGAAAIDKKVAEGFNNFGITTIQGYGLTETSPVLIAENKYNIRYGSVGTPLCNVEIKIDEPNEQGIGEIIARGPNVMLGYYNNEEATKEVLIDGWFHTGDLGFIDKDGYIFITGRKKNVIVLKNGKNIYPEELESLINNLIYVSESMVFGLPKDDDLLLSAKIVYNKDYIQETYPNITEKELYDMIWSDIKKINSSLTNFKHIKHIIITDEPMIKTSTAKIKRFQEIEKIIKENDK